MMSRIKGGTRHWQLICLRRSSCSETCPCDAGTRMGADCEISHSLQSFRAFRGDRLWRNQGCRDTDDTRMAEAWSGQGITANAIGPDFSQLN